MLTSWCSSGAIALSLQVRATWSNLETNWWTSTSSSGSTCPLVIPLPPSRTTPSPPSRLSTSPQLKQDSQLRYVHTFTHVRTFQCVCLCVSVYLCIHTVHRVCVYLYLHTYIPVCVHTYISNHTCVSVYVCLQYTLPEAVSYDFSVCTYSMCVYRMHVLCVHVDLTTYMCMYAAPY